MLRRTFAKLVLLASMLSSLTGSAALATAEGPGVSGGGDAMVAEFQALARQVLKELPADFVHRPKLEFAVSIATVESTTKTIYVNGVEKDAENIPRANKIRFNRTRWNMIQDQALKKVLVLHEYLGLIGADDGAYNISAEEVRIIHKLSYKPEPTTPAECARAVIRNNCNLDYGNRAQLCLRATSGYGIKALDAAFAAAASSGCDVSDHAFADLLKISNPTQLECVTTTIASGKSILYGSRAYLCRKAQSEYGVQALSIALKSAKNSTVDDQDFHDILTMNHPRHRNCIKAIQESNCNIRYASRINLCKMAQSPFAVKAFGESLAEMKCNLEDYTQRNLMKITSETQKNAVSAINSNNCSISFRSRSAIVLRFQTESSVQIFNETIKANGCGFSDATMEALTQM
jgi:hypothetical protein